MRTGASSKLFVLRAEKAAKKEIWGWQISTNTRAKGKDQIYLFVPNLPVHIVRHADASRQNKLWAKILGFFTKHYYILSEYHTLVRFSRFLQVEKYQGYFRMDPTAFHKPLDCVKDSITKIRTNMRKPINAEERLGVTLQ